MSLELSLYELQEGLRELYAMREEARAQMDAAPDSTAGEFAGQIDVINESITQYLRAEIRKVDGTADFILMLDRLCHEPRERKGVTERCEIDQEIDRLRSRRDNLRAIVANVKERVAFVMNEMPWREGKPKKLEGVRHTMTLRGNGGAMPVEITDESLVPDEYCRVTVTMPAQVWPALLDLAREMAAMNGYLPSLSKDIACMKIGPREVSRSAVAEALNQPCPDCDTGYPEGRQCPSCGGTAKRGVPGARFAPRSESLQIR